LLEIETWLAAFDLDGFLHGHVARVVAALPSHVRADLIGDPDFRMSDYEPGPGVVMRVRVGMPQRSKPSRGIVLKRTLRHRPESFVRYVIAHELAHAHLRNGGRFAGDDPERAADALAADWGFPRPA
jgi:hypothetical protein